jgi:hypothetical protein
VCLKVVVMALEVMSEEQRPASPGTRPNSNFALSRDTLKLNFMSSQQIAFSTFTIITRLTQINNTTKQ